MEYFEGSKKQGYVFGSSIRKISVVPEDCDVLPSRGKFG